MKRHASTDELADLAAGVLRPRRAAKIATHLAGCTQCTDVSNQLSAVSSTLASVSVAPMPDLISSRIETALAAESAHRLASAPATEAGRRELPARSRHSSPSGQGWRIFGLSGPASRLVTAAGALVVIGGGGYVIAAEVNSSPATNQSASSAGSAGVPTQHLNAGLSVPYHYGGATRILHTVTSGTNFTGHNLAKYAVAALTAARHSGVIPGTGAASSTRATPQATVLPNTAGPTKGQLTGCVSAIAAGKAVLLVDLAKFDGQPAIIVMIAAATAGSAEVWAVRDSCTAANTQVLDHAKVAHT